MENPLTISSDFYVIFHFYYSENNSDEIEKKSILFAGWM